MSPFQRNLPGTQPNARQGPDDETHITMTMSSTKTRMSPNQSTSDTTLVSSSSQRASTDMQQEHRQSNIASPSVEEGSPSPNYTFTYVDRATQTSPLPPASHPFLVTAQYPQFYPYPITYVHSPQPYSHSLLWLPASPPSLFPAPVQASFYKQTAGNVSEREHQGSRNVDVRPTSTGFPSASTATRPFYTYYPYQQQIAPVSSPQANGTRSQPDSTPLIAPLPQLPLPEPEALSLVLEQLSPTISTTTAAPKSAPSLMSPPASLIHRRSVSTTPSRGPTSPVENPSHSLYKSLRSLLLISESEPSFLAREISGEQLVSVHGVGIWSCRGSTPSLEITKKKAFQAHCSYDAWLRTARVRTAHYATPGAVRPPLRWVLIENNGIKHVQLGEQKVDKRRHNRKKDRIVFPDDALQTGTEASGEKLYCARAWWEGGVHLGKAAAHLQDGGASISHGSLEHSLSTFEILVGDSQYAKWVDVPKGTVLNFQPSVEGEKLSCYRPPEEANVDNTSGVTEVRPSSDSDAPQCSDTLSAMLPASFTPVEGGREASGAPLFVAQAEYDRGWHPGKASLGDDHCCIAYGGGELWVKGFRMLGYNV